MFHRFSEASGVRPANTSRLASASQEIGEMLRLGLKMSLVRPSGDGQAPRNPVESLA